MLIIERNNIELNMKGVFSGIYSSIYTLDDDIIGIKNKGMNVYTCDIYCKNGFNRKLIDHVSKCNKGNTYLISINKRNLKARILASNYNFSKVSGSMFYNIYKKVM
jgi:hypothetical protein